MNRFVLLFGMILAGFLALGMFQAKTGASQSAKEIARLKEDIAVLKEEIIVLEKEYETLASQEQIARLAAEELNMGPARSWQMLDPDSAEARLGPLVRREDVNPTGEAQNE